MADGPLPLQGPPPTPAPPAIDPALAARIRAARLKLRAQKLQAQMAAAPATAPAAAPATAPAVQALAPEPSGLRPSPNWDLADPLTQPIPKPEVAQAEALDRRYRLHQDVLVPDTAGPSFGSAVANAPAALATGIPNQMGYGGAGILDAVGALSPETVNDVRMSNADVQRAAHMDLGGSPNLIEPAVQTTEALAPFAIPGMAPAGIAGMGGAAFENARQAGASRTRATGAGAAMTALGVVAPWLSRAATPAANAVVGTADNFVANRLRGALTGVPAGAAFGVGSPAVTAISDPEAAKAELKDAGTTTGVMAALSALFGHGPGKVARAAPTKPDQSPEARANAPTESDTPTPAERPTQPVRPASEPAAAEPAAAPSPVAPPAPKMGEAKPQTAPIDSTYVKSPDSAEESVKFSHDYAQELAPERNGPPMAPLGGHYTDLPGGMTGRLVDYEPVERTQKDGEKRTVLRYKFQLDDGTTKSFKASEIADMQPSDQPHRPVVVKRRGQGAQDVRPQLAPARPTPEPVPERPAAPRADEAPAESAPEVTADGGHDEPRPFERQDTGQVSEVQQLTSETGRKRFMQSVIDRHLSEGRPEEAAKWQTKLDTEFPAASDRKVVAPSEKPVTEHSPAVSSGREIGRPKLDEPVMAPKPEVVERQVPEPRGNGDSHAPSVHEDTQDVEHRAREFGLNRQEAATVEGKPGANDHPDIPEHVRGAAEFIAGRKHFESKQHWQQWWDSLPGGMKRGVRDITGVEHGDLTSTDEQGHVVTAAKRPVAVPQERQVRVSNLEGADRSLKMDVHALDADANISYTAGSEARGHVETLPRYYIGQVTDPHAPPGARGKWTVLDWNPNNDEHFQNHRPQRVPFRDIPTVKAIGGSSKRGLQRSDIYDSYTDAKNAALDIVAKTKRNRDLNAAERFGKGEQRELGPGDLAEKDPVSAEDIKSGRVGFRTREQITGDDPNAAMFTKGNEREYHMDRLTDATIKRLEKLHEQGKTPEEIANDPAIAEMARAVDALGKNWSRRGSFNGLNDILDLVERGTKALARIIGRAIGVIPKRISNLYTRATQMLARAAQTRTTVTKEFRDQVVDRMLKDSTNPDVARKLLGQRRELGLPKDSLSKQLGDAIRWAAGARKWMYSRFRHLNLDKPQDARFANHLRLAMDPHKAAMNKAAVVVADITAPLQKPEMRRAYHAFSDKLVLEELIHSVEHGDLYGQNDVVPFTGGLRVRDGAVKILKESLDAVNREVSQTPEAVKAVAQHYKELHEVQGALIMAGELPPEQLGKPYIRHQVDKYYNSEAKEARDQPRSVRIAGARPSAFKHRTGSAENYNSAYEEHALDGFSQAYAKLNTVEFDRYLDTVSKHEEVRDHIHKINSQAFEDKVHDGDPAVYDSGLAGLARRLNDGFKPGRNYKKYAGLFDAIRAAPKLDASFNHDDLSNFLGDVVHNRDALALDMKQDVLGNKYRAPHDMGAATDLLPADHVAIETEDGQTYHPVTTAQPDLLKEIEANGEAMASAKDFGTALAMGARRIARVVPREYAAQMAETLKPPDPAHALEKVSSAVARNLIHSPVAFEGYMLTNALGNGSMMFIQNPMVATKLPVAAKLLYKFHYNLALTNAERAIMDAAIRQRVIQQHGVGQFDDAARQRLKSLVRHSTGEGFAGKTAWDKIKWAADWYRRNISRPGAAMVDDVPKLADFLYEQDKQSGKFGIVRRTADTLLAQRGGAANPAEFRAAESPEDAAGVHARQSYVDFGSMSQFAHSQAGRRLLQKFYGWTEGGGKWMMRALANPIEHGVRDWQEGRKLQGAASIAGNTTKLAVKIGVLHLGIAMFNQRENSEDTRRKAKMAGIDLYNNLLLGQDSAGRVRSIPTPWITSWFMRKIGLPDPANILADTVGGESSTRTMSDVLSQMPKRALFQEAQSSMASVPLAALGQRIDAKHMDVVPVQQGEGWKSAIAALGYRQIGQALDDAPQPHTPIADLITRATDPEDAQYYKAKQLVDDWKAKAYPADVGGSGGERSLAANALHDMKAAMKLGDEDKAVQALNTYYYTMDGDHRPSSVKQSIGAMSPEVGLGGKKDEFLGSLTDSERKTWDEANTYFSSWSDPYKNPQLADVLGKAASADQTRFHEQMKLYANEVRQNNPGAEGLDKSVPARIFQKLDAGAKKLDSVGADGNRLREAARGVFRESAPATK